jgi:hypothetical protein
MNRRLRTELKRLLAATALAAPLLVLAAAGEFTFVTGEVSLLKANGQRVAPAKGLAVDAGDRISTGPNGMAQLTMVDQARLSIRPNTVFAIEQYPDRKDSSDGAILSLLKGTLRTFTGLIATSNRDKFVMKTRVATVGIRGSGNILYACEGQECDASVTGEIKGEGAITVNHTIEGSHSVTNTQGAGQTLITGPGQTVLVLNNQVPRYIPTPKFIAEVATNMTNAKPGDATGSGTAGTTRAFAPGDVVAVPTSQQNTTPIVGNNGLGFTTIDASVNLANDPVALRDVIIAANGSPLAGQAVQDDVTLSGNELRGYRSYAASGSGLEPAIVGGTPRDFNAIVLSNGTIVMGRYENADLGYFGPGSGTHGHRLVHARGQHLADQPGGHDRHHRRGHAFRELHQPHREPGPGGEHSRNRGRQLAAHGEQHGVVPEPLLRLHQRPPGDHQRHGPDLDQQPEPHRQRRGQPRGHRPVRGDPRIRHLRSHRGLQRQLEHRLRCRRLTRPPTGPTRWWATRRDASRRSPRPTGGSAPTRPMRSAPPRWRSREPIPRAA